MKETHFKKKTFFIKNTSVRKSVLAVAKLSSFNYKFLEHPLYSPDLYPTVDYFFKKLEKNSRKEIIFIG